MFNNDLDAARSRASLSGHSSPLRPVASVMLCDADAEILEFYGLYWVQDANGSRTGFFDREMDAVRYLQSPFECSAA